MNLAQLSVAESAAAIRAGEITSVELVDSCLARIAEREETVQAWAYLDPEHARKQARERHEARQAGMALGPLHGVPVGVKDIFDTSDMPTEDGTVLHAGRRPLYDCTVVSQLRQAGAVIMGKTVTTELAVLHPAKTRNPHNPEHTPGGSSSGSAAAVADTMVPAALGSQTNGSTIRPASYCGIYGFKPSFGLISRHGVLRCSRHLDHVGVFARTVEDVALIAEAIMGYDAHDLDMAPMAPPDLLNTSRDEPPVTPNFAFVKTPVWDQADSVTHEAFAELVEALGERVTEVPLSAAFDDAVASLRTDMDADLALNFAKDFERAPDKFSDTLRPIIERWQRVLAVDYNRAAGRRDGLNHSLESIFERYDAIITPAATGVAPTISSGNTGSPIFSTIWTLCGTPAISMPMLAGAQGLPLGVQLVGRRGDDARLLRSARWLAGFAAAAAGELD